MYNLEKALKRFVIAVWFVCFLVLLPLSLIFGPFVWMLTGEWPAEWLMDHAEPFEMAENWKLTKR